ncbi:hypothetical protein AVEN_127146-1 [Araneus ventricosus]|uniref:Uncharacterized protein n=1 Tax=Araneus ventricosus TaxID=182803 RepID=A0A4Y2IRH7_ARAVE|nr:hypothetical protein AVEN_127146-1 [Araneus ventricosus]
MESSKKGSPTEFGLKILQKLYPKIAPRAAQIQPHQTLLEEEKFSQQEIDDILKNIPNGKAPGYDGIDNIIVKTSPVHLIVFNTLPSEIDLLPSLSSTTLAKRFLTHQETEKWRCKPAKGRSFGNRLRGVYRVHVAGNHFGASWQTKSFWYSGLKEFIYKHLPMTLRSSLEKTPEKVSEISAN